MGATGVKCGDLGGGTTETSGMLDFTEMAECTRMFEPTEIVEDRADFTEMAECTRMFEPTEIVEDRAEMDESS
jgi:hypothetical protein